MRKKIIRYMMFLCMFFLLFGIKTSLVFANDSITWVNFELDEPKTSMNTDETVTVTTNLGDGSNCFTDIQVQWLSSGDEIGWKNEAWGYHIPGLSYKYKVSYKLTGSCNLTNTQIKLNGENALLIDDNTYESKIWNGLEPIKVNYVYYEVDAPLVGNTMDTTATIKTDPLGVNAYGSQKVTWYVSDDNVSWKEMLPSSYYEEGKYYKYSTNTFLESSKAIDCFDFTDAQIKLNGNGVNKISAYVGESQVFGPLSKIEINRIEITSYQLIAGAEPIEIKIVSDIPGSLTSSKMRISWFESDDGNTWEKLGSFDNVKVNKIYRGVISSFPVKTGYTITDNTVFVIDGNEVGSYPMNSSNLELYTTTYGPISPTEIGEIKPYLNPPIIAKEIDKINALHKECYYVYYNETDKVCVNVPYNIIWQESIDGVTWTDTTTDRFVSGKYYKNQIRFVSDENLDLSNVVVKSKENELTKISDFIYEGVVYNKLDKVIVNNVSGTISNFIANDIPQEKITINYNGNNYFFQSYFDLDLNWYESNDGITWIDMSSDKFNAGMYYKAVFDYFSYNNEMFDFELASVEVNGKVIEPNDDNLFESEIFGPILRQSVSASVTIDEPVYEETPIKKVLINENVSETLITKELDVEWYESNDNLSWVRMTTDTFELNKYYKYIINFNVDSYSNYKLTSIYLNDEYINILENTSFESKIWNFGLAEVYNKVVAAWPKQTANVFAKQYLDYFSNNNLVEGFSQHIYSTLVLDNCMKELYEYFKDDKAVIDALNAGIIKIKYKSGGSYYKFSVINTIDNTMTDVTTKKEDYTIVSDEEWEKSEVYDGIITGQYIYYPLNDFLDKEYYKEKNRDKYYSEFVDRFIEPLFGLDCGYDIYYTEYMGTQTGHDKLRRVVYIMKDGLIYNAFETGYSGPDNRVFFPVNTRMYEINMVQYSLPLAQHYFQVFSDPEKYNYHIEYAALIDVNKRYYLIMDDGSNYMLELYPKYDYIYSEHLLEGMNAEYDIAINIDIQNDIGGNYLETLIKEHINNRSKYEKFEIITSGNISKVRVYYPIKGMENYLQYEEIEITFNYNESLGIHGDTSIENVLVNIPNEIKVPALDYAVDMINDFKYENITRYLKEEVLPEDIQIKLLNATVASGINHLTMLYLFGKDDVYYDYKTLEIYMDDYIVSYEDTDVDNIHNEITKYISDNTKDSIYDVSIKYSYDANVDINLNNKEKHDKVGYVIYSGINDRSFKMHIYRKYPVIDDIIIEYDKDYIIINGEGVQLNIKVISEQEIYSPIELTYNTYFLNITDDFYVTTTASYIDVYPITACVKGVCKTVELTTFTVSSRAAYEAYNALPSKIEGKHEYAVIDKYYKEILSKYIKNIPEDIRIETHNENGKLYYSILYVPNNNYYNNKEVSYELVSSDNEIVNDILQNKTQYSIPLGLSNYYYNNQTEEYINKSVDYIQNIINDSNITLELMNYTYNYNSNFDNYILYDFILKYNDEYYIYSNVNLKLDQFVFLDYDIRDNQILDYVKGVILNNIDVDGSLISFNYNKTLSNQLENEYVSYGNLLLGAYNIDIDGNIIPIGIYREDRTLTNIELSKDFDRLIIENGVYKINYSITPNDGYYEKIVWVSNDEEIAVVDQNGMITGLKSGFVTITAYSAIDGTVSDTIEIEVVHKLEDDIIEIMNDIPEVLFNKYSKDILDNYWKKIILTDLKFYLSNVDYELQKISDNIYNLILSKTDMEEIYQRNKYISVELAANSDLVNDVYSKIDDVYNLTLTESIKLGNMMDWLNIYMEKIGLVMNNTNYTMLEPILVEGAFSSYIDVVTFIGEGNSYSKYKTIRLVKFNQMEVPYDIRTYEDLNGYILNILKEDISFNQSKYQLSYDESLTNNYDFNQENMGIYNIKYTGNVNIIVLREERQITNIDLSQNNNVIVLEDGSIKLNLIVNPDNAYYEVITWKNSDTSVVSVSNEGVVSPIKPGIVKISACNGEVCDSLDITVKTRAQINLDEAYQFLPETLPNYSSSIDFPTVYELYNKYITYYLNYPQVQVSTTITNTQVLVDLTISDEYGEYHLQKGYAAHEVMLNTNPLIEVLLGEFNNKYDLKTSLYNNIYEYSASKIKEEFGNLFDDNDILYGDIVVYENNCDIGYDKDVCYLTVIYVYTNDNAIDGFNVAVENTKSLLVPYETRTNEQLLAKVKEILSKSHEINENNLMLEYNEELTNSYSIEQENMGIYNLIVDGNILPITIYREENRITDITINSDVDYIIREQNNKLQLNYTFNPTDAIYEVLEWYSSDETIATVDEFGMVTAIKSGTVCIGLKNDYINTCKDIKIYTEPEYTINEIKNWWKYSSEYYYSLKLLDDEEAEKFILQEELKQNITDERVSFRYRRGAVYSSYINYYITLLIENTDGTIYESEEIIFKVDRYNSDFQIEEYPSSVTLSLKTTTLNNFEEYLTTVILSAIRNFSTADSIKIISSEIIPDGIGKQINVELLIGNKKYYDVNFFQRITLNIKGTYDIEVPYEIRTEEQLEKYIKDYYYDLTDINRKYFSIQYSEELTDSYEFTQDNLGVYFISSTYSAYANTIPVAIRREEKELTNIEISNAYNKIPLDIYGGGLKLKVNITPNDAIYEKINWISLDETIATVDEFGVVRPVSLGKVLIKGYYGNGDVYDTYEIEVVAKDSIKISTIKGDLYLYDDGSLYKKVGYYLEFIDSNVKEIQTNFYYIKEDNALYYYTHPNNNYYNITITKVMDNVKYSSNTYLLTLSGDVYKINNGVVEEKIIENIIKYDENMYLTTDGKLYVVGENRYGEKFNDNNYIETPMLFFENVLDYSDNYVLLKDKTLYTYSKYTISPEIVETDVLEILIFSGTYYIDYGEVRYAVKKENEVAFGKIFVRNKIFNYERKSKKDIRYFDYFINYDNVWTEYYYIDNSNTLYVDENTKVAENVKEAFVTAFDYTHKSYIHFITYDNKLYRYTGDIYKIADNIESYISNNVFLTTNNDLWSWWGEIDYPSKLVKVESEEIKVEDIYIYEFTTTKVTVGKTIDILGIVLPYNATNNKIIWSVDNEEIATIDEHGVFNAISPGKVIVTAKTEDGNFEASIEISVHPKVSEVKIYGEYDKFVPTSIYDSYDYRFTLYANVGPEDALERMITWASSDESIAFINSIVGCSRYDEFGNSIYYDSCAYVYVKQKTGEVTIHAISDSGKFMDSITFNVVPNMGMLSFEEKYITINLGKNSTHQIKPIHYPENFDISILEYVSTVEDVAEVNEEGLITGKSEGSAVIEVYAFGEIIENIFVNIIKKLEPIFDFIEGILDKTKAIISKITAGTDVETLKNSIENNEEIKVLSCKEGYCTEITSGIIKTGYKINYINSNDEIITYDLSVFGDVSTDGKVNAVDLAVLLNHISGTKTIEGAALESAYMNNDNKVNAVDLAHMLNHIAGKEGF